MIPSTILRFDIFLIISSLLKWHFLNTRLSLFKSVPWFGIRADQKLKYPRDDDRRSGSTIESIHCPFQQPFHCAPAGLAPHPRYFEFVSSGQSHLILDLYFSDTWSVAKCIANSNHSNFSVFFRSYWEDRFWRHGPMRSSQTRMVLQIQKISIPILGWQIIFWSFHIKRIRESVFCRML